MNIFRFIFIQVTDIIQKQVSLIEWYCPNWLKPKSFIDEVNDTEQNGTIQNEKHLFNIVEFCPQL
jgi:hypothetical protein